MAIQSLIGDEMELATRATALRLVEDSSPRFRVGRDVAHRRASRERMLRRRRRSVLAAAAAASLLVLAWPGHAFGGVTNSGVAVDQADSSLLAPGMVYVVRSGDSVDSIANLVNPSDPTAARALIVSEIRSNVVVPGEHVAIP